MFPNRYNIYLHDTPQKQLFGREKRDFSHGCIRLQKPFEFAYTLLARQTDDPRGLFHATLDTGRETRIDLVDPVPVHIVYRTAFTQAKGRMQYRGDVYGRDAPIFRGQVVLDLLQVLLDVLRAEVHTAGHAVSHPGWRVFGQDRIGGCQRQLMFVRE